jgi:CO/xanthine dehydrogenase FAD-binding subunit
VKPPAFDYHRPATLGEALAQLGQFPGAKPLAGGQSLIPAMNFRLAAPAVLVDLSALGELEGIAERPGGGLRIGAMTTHRCVERDPLVARHAPLLAEAMPFVAHPQIRSRGTLGGSLAHADPAAELPAVMVALEAELLMASTRGERRVKAGDFFTGLFATALEAGELVMAVELPALSPRTGSAFQEFSRRHGDYALAGAATSVTLDGAGRVERARIALFSVGDGPMRSPSGEAALVGSMGDAAAVAKASQALQADLDPPADIHASSAYRRQLATVLTGRALTAAVARARNGSA